MDDELLRRKQLVREQFLGKGGIHGVGVRAKERVVCVYVQDESQLRDEMRAAIKAVAAPFGLCVVRATAPQIGSDNARKDHG